MPNLPMRDHVRCHDLKSGEDAFMAEERRILCLARIAGAEGQRLAAAIMQQTERLLTAA